MNTLEKKILNLQPKLYNLALSYVRNTTDAEDIVNNLYLKVFERFHLLRDDHIEGYLFRSLKHESINFIRKKNLKIENIDDNFVENMLPQKHNIEHQIFTEEIQSKLINPKYKYLLMYINGFSYKEIAMLANKLMGTIKASISYSKAALRVELKEYL